MNRLTGLVLCGGGSTRMGTDKSQLVYHGIPQYQHVYNLIKLHCEETLISCRPQQISYFDSLPVLADASTFGEIGPMAALLTAFERYPDHSFLVVGCDYPYLTAADIDLLIQSRQNAIDAVCFQNDQGFDEPLISILENAVKMQLAATFNRGHYSMRHFLGEVKTQRILPYSKQSIVNVNSPLAADISVAKTMIL